MASTFLLISLYLFSASLGVFGDDYYQILGLERNADNRELRRAYKKLAMINHPDKNKDDPDAHDKFVKINRAYEVLKDEDLRKKYDQFGEEGLKDDFQGGQNFRSWQFFQNFGIYDEDPEITTLGSVDFEQLVQNSGDFWFVNYYSPACSHCHHLAPAVSDGNQADPEEEVIREREKILALPNVNIYAAGTEVHSGEDHVNEKGLKEITGSARRVFEAPNDLRDTLRTLSRTIACEPPPPPPTTTPIPTTTTLPPTGCELDLLLIIDSSSSVEEIHKLYIERAIEIVQKVRVGPRYTQVSMVRYSSKFNTDPEFHFNTYYDKNKITAAIKNANYPGGMTNTYWALMLGKEQYELKKYGARPKNEADKIAVIFTDGFSYKNPADSAQKLRRIGVDVHVSAISEGFYEPNYEELEIIAGNKNKIYVEDSEFREFLNFMSKYNCR